MFCETNNNNYNELKGEVLLINVKDKIIANMFSQKPNFDTDYEAMEEAFKKIKANAGKEHSIAIPYKIGCRYSKWRLEYSL